MLPGGADTAADTVRWNPGVPSIPSRGQPDLMLRKNVGGLAGSGPKVRGITPDMPEAYKLAVLVFFVILAWEHWRPRR